MPVSGSKMGQGPVGRNTVKYKKPAKGTKTVNAMRPIKKGRKK